MNISFEFVMDSLEISCFTGDLVNDITRQDIDEFLPSQVRWVLV